MNEWLDEALSELKSLLTTGDKAISVTLLTMGPEGFPVVYAIGPNLKPVASIITDVNTFADGCENLFDKYAINATPKE